MSGALLSAKLGREISVEELYEIEALRTEPTARLAHTVGNLTKKLLSEGV